MREQAEACAAFFRERPGYQRILSALRQKYQRYGRPAGTVCLPDASEEECQAARAIFGRSFLPPLKFQTAEFENELQHTYPDVSLKEVLELYFGTEIRTKSDLRQARNRRLSDLLTQAAQATQGAGSRRWLDALAKHRDCGYAMLCREAGADEERAAHALRHACRSMDLLEANTGGPIRLAVLSAQTAANPHALDSGTLCGKLFLHLLAFCSDREYPDSAELRDELYYAHGILCDSISSTVSQVGLVLETDSGEHPGFAQFRFRNEICTLTLANLSTLTGARSPVGRAYLVENEMVFTQLCDRANQFRAPLICTSGQPSVAALRLLDLLADAGTALFYSSDLDGKGLSIAASLDARYPGLLTPWHMAPEDYARCQSGVRLSEASMALLPKCVGTPLEAAAKAVEHQGCAGYQELLLPWLETDLTRTP